MENHLIVYQFYDLFDYLILFLEISMLALLWLNSHEISLHVVLETLNSS